MMVAGGRWILPIARSKGCFAVRVFCKYAAVASVKLSFSGARVSLGSVMSMACGQR